MSRSIGSPKLQVKRPCERGDSPRSTACSLAATLSPMATDQDQDAGAAWAKESRAWVSRELARVRWDRQALGPVHVAKARGCDVQTWRGLLWCLKGREKITKLRRANLAVMQPMRAWCLTQGLTPVRRCLAPCVPLVRATGNAPGRQAR